MTNLDSISKSRDITLQTKVCLVKAMVFPVVMYGCESWTIKKAECGRIDAFELWCWQRLLRIPWTARRFSTVQFSRSVVSDSLWPHESQHTRSSCPSPTARVYPNPCPLSRWCNPTISSFVVSFPPIFKLSQHQDLFKWVNSLQQVAKVLEFQLQHQSFQQTFRTNFLKD